ncbi:MAG: hypothetical protein PHW04_08405 [Candidatus Wallbacteria bacterium]|nr:hypothetical protein [Candidatus Wallbacteria bacterium]
MVKSTLTVILVLLLVYEAAAAGTGITFFGKKQYEVLLAKYSAKIDEGSFQASELLNEVGGIRSNYVLALISQLLEKVRVSDFMQKNTNTDNERILESYASRSGRAGSGTPSIGQIEFSALTATQYTAKRAYNSNPFHHPMTNWFYDYSSVEPFTVGVLGSHENASVFYGYSTVGPGFYDYYPASYFNSIRSYSTWYRLYLTFDLSALPYPINIVDSYLKIDRINIHCGKEEEGGMSVGFLSTTEIHNFYDLDTFGRLSEATVATYGYGSAKEWVKISPLDDIVPYWMDKTAHGIVVNFKPLSDRDYDNWFYFNKIWKRNVKLVVRYEL